MAASTDIVTTEDPPHDLPSADQRQARQPLSVAECPRRTPIGSPTGGSRKPPQGRASDRASRQPQPGFPCAPGLPLEPFFPTSPPAAPGPSTATAALVFLASAALGKPLTEIAAAPFMTGTNLDGTTRAALHGLHQRITIVIGALLIAEVAARLIIIFTLPFDVANGLVAVISGVALPAIFVVVGLMVPRFTARIKQRQCGKPDNRHPGGRRLHLSHQETPRSASRMGR